MALCSHPTLLGLLTGFALAHSSLGVITVTTGYVDCMSNGVVGRMGSNSGNNIDDPPQLNGTSGVLTLAAQSSGGPVPPGPLTTLPGTNAQHLESASVLQRFQGDGSTYLIVTQIGQFNNSLMDMDGAGLSASSNAVGVCRMTFTVTTPTPYTLTGTINLDDQDVSGTVRLTNAIGIAIYLRAVANNGTFSTSGVLNPGSYALQCNASVSAVAGQPDVGSVGNFSESSSYSAVLTLGTPPACDSIDFNNDGLLPDTGDLDDFLSVFSGGPCSTNNCNDIDFNNDGLFPDTADLDALLSVFSGGPCL
jgi:hypothetical protein